MTAAGPIALCAALFLVGCASDPGTRGGFARIGQLGPQSLDGRVRVVGNHPFAHPIVVPEEGDAIRVSGPYEREIGRLSGIDVRVTGEREYGTYPEETLRASSYEVLSVEGDSAVVGTLDREGDGWVVRTQSGDVSLSVVTEPLAALRGSVVWVVLDENAGAGRYGLLREALR